MIVYKYCSFETAKLIISTNTLKFTNPDNFNDPFDCDVDTVDFDFTGNHHKKIDDDIKQMVDEDMGRPFSKKYVHNALKNPNLLSELYREANLNKVKDVSITCFSKKPDIIQMWAYYGDDHKGMCLGFDLNCINKFVDIDNEGLSFLPVKYKNFLKPKFKYATNPVNGIKIILRTKEESWNHEAEFRILLLKPEGLYKFNNSFLKSVHFGLKVDKANRDEFIQSCNAIDNHKYDLYQLTKGSLKLNEEKIPLS